MNAILLGIGMFTLIPVKKARWDEGNGPGAVCSLPFIGVLVGIVPFLVARFFGSLPASSRAFLLLLGCYSLTGFLHLDGYMDCADSLLSSRDREGKLRILKDSNVGAFSVVAVVLLLVGEYAAFCCWDAASVSPLYFLVIPAASRAFSAVFIFTYPTLENSSLVKYFKTGANKSHTYTAVSALVACLALALALNLAKGLALIASGGVAYLFVRKAYRDLGGINGDVAGASIIVNELVAYFLIVLINRPA